MHRSRPVSISAFALALAIGGCSGATEDTKAKTNESAAKEAPKVAEKDADVAKPEATAAERPVDVNVDEKGQGLHGYDPVAYQVLGKPTLGVASNSFDWGGATWLFASADNMKKFREDPKRYAPHNGGFCTFGVVIGKKFDGDPQVWHIKDDNLYVFLDAEVKDKFFQDEAGNFEKVSTNWSTIKDKKPEELTGAE